MKAVLALHNLDRLMDGYGIHMEQNAVLDFGAPWSIQITKPARGLATLQHPGIVIVVDSRTRGKTALLDSTFSGFNCVEELAFPFPSSVAILRDRQPTQVALKVVGRTTRESTMMTSDVVDMQLKHEWHPAGAEGEFAIAAVAEGPLRSAFISQNSNNVSLADNAVSPSRVLVIGSSLFLTNPFAYCGNDSNAGASTGGKSEDPLLQHVACLYAERYLVESIVAVKGILDWMTADAELPDSVSK